MKPIQFLAFAICSFSVLGCSKSAPVVVEQAPPEIASSNEVSLTAEQVEAGGIETTLVREMPMQAEMKVSGTVTSNAKGRALVTPPVSGKILQIFVEQGDEVRQGQSLATIQSPELAQAASSISEAQQDELTAEANVRKELAELDLARARKRTAQAQLTRQKELAKAGAFSQPPLQAAQNELNDAQSDLDSARQDEAVHQTQLDRAERLFKQELISRTDLEQARLAVSQDQVNRRRAEGRVSTATSALNREQNIASKGLLTSREIQAAEAEARAANLEVQRAEIHVEASKSSLSGARKAVSNAQSNFAAVRGAGNGGGSSTVTLTAPLTGTVTERKATIGQSVERASELFEIENLKTVWVTANVPEKEVAKITRGMRVRIIAAAYPDKTFVGEIQILGNHLEGKTRTMPVQCLVQNPSGLLREDMFATVMLGIGKAASVRAVPDNAIVRGNQEVSVFVARDSTYEKRTVEMGRSAGGYTEVLSGLKAGESVVSKGLFVVESESRKGELKGED
ncbi:hypothetical protein BH11ARM1_BH11ARM1_02400 [soil metagenome]